MASPISNGAEYASTESEIDEDVNVLLINKQCIMTDPCSSISVENESVGMINVYVENQRNIRIIMLFLVLCLNIALYVDIHYCYMDNIGYGYIADLSKTTLSVMGCHLVIEHFLENIIYSIKRDDMILYSTTACLRDIINNFIMTFLYIFDDYGYWFRPLMWGCYMADLVMLLTKWNYFKSSWLKFVFMHHFGVSIMLFILNHTTKILTDNALIIIIIFMNSNTPGCCSPIWKAFKLPFYEWSSIICFIIQRIIRCTNYILIAIIIEFEHFMKKDYGYIVLLVFAVILDIWDIYTQIISIYKYYKKQQENTD